MDRYKNECFELTQLALMQLNNPKNACKARFETLDIRTLLKLIKDELDELELELEDLPLTVDRAREELADCAACLVGTLAYINQFKREEDE